MIKIEKEYKNWLYYHFRQDNQIRYAGATLVVLAFLVEPSDVITPLGSAKSNILFIVSGLALIIFGPDILKVAKSWLSKFKA